MLKVVKTTPKKSKKLVKKEFWIVAKESFMTKGKASFLTSIDDDYWSETQTDAHRFNKKEKAENCADLFPKVYGCVVLYGYIEVNP